MCWDRTDQRIKGTYLEMFEVTGVVQSSRIKYGGRVQHTVLLDSPIEVFGAVRDTVLLDEEDLAL